MSVKDEALALLAEEPKDPVPPEIAPLLLELSVHAKAGRKLSTAKLIAVVEKKTGRIAGRSRLQRWVREAGGEPWFSK